MITFTELLFEVAKRKVIWRDRKRKVVKRTNKDGYKTVDGREVKMSAAEKRNRHLAQKKAAKKRKSKKHTSNIKRELTNKKRLHGK